MSSKRVNWEGNVRKRRASRATDESSSNKAEGERGTVSERPAENTSWELLRMESGKGGRGEASALTRQEDTLPRETE